MTIASFLPEDYLAQKAERRTNMISLTLFGVVMVSVIGAFFVTNRTAKLEKEQNAAVSVSYQQAAPQIEDFKKLEQQKAEMLNKAELASALVERVPRSILLAELINRMPERLSLLDFEIKSEKVKPPVQAGAAKNARGGSLKSGAPERAKTKQEAADEPPKIEPPRYKATITMTGVAPTDVELANFMAELNAYSLLRDVALEYSEQKEVEGRSMRQFKITMSLDPTADVRRIDPLAVPRVRDPISDNFQISMPVPPGALPPAPPATPDTTKEGR
jgi:Tfp pilus assembly protein PilN